MDRASPRDESALRVAQDGAYQPAALLTCRTDHCA
jgi:hypothetical protein